MLPSSARTRRIIITFWVLAVVTIPVRALLATSGWDMVVYYSAIRAVHTGNDPYLEGISTQAAYDELLARHHTVTGDRPNIYVYPPLSVPLLRILGNLPTGLIIGSYLLLYVLGALTIILAGMQLAEEEERSLVAFIAPCAAFFPALLRTKLFLAGTYRISAMARYWPRS